MSNEYELMDLADIVGLLGVSDRMVRNYIKDNGLPFVGDGRGRRFVWRDVLEWYVSYRIAIGGNGRSELAGSKPAAKETYEEAILRKTSAEADLRELELAVKRGDVVPVSEVEASVSKVASGMKVAILAMPSKLTTRLYGIKDKNQMRSVFDREARDMCERLANLGSESAGELTDGN